MNPDISIENHGAIFLFGINSCAAAEWVAENVHSEAQFVSDALAVEHRYAHCLAEGMSADGLVLA